MSDFLKSLWTKWNLFVEKPNSAQWKKLFKLKKVEEQYNQINQQDKSLIENVYCCSETFMYMLHKMIEA